jgi:hypothetical protein
LSGVSGVIFFLAKEPGIAHETPGGEILVAAAYIRKLVPRMILSIKVGQEVHPKNRFSKV